MTEHVLDGCRPVPLASYLKALGVLRLVSEQRDPDARGAWRGETFVLTTALDRSALEEFFLEEYRPTPIVAPWNGGSGFYPKGQASAFEARQAIVESTCNRLSGYRAAIQVSTAVVESLGVGGKVEGGEKEALIEALRASLSDDVVVWLDAVVALSNERLRFPPLLGTGGNDGKLEFSANFMRRLPDLFSFETGSPRGTTRELIQAALRGGLTGALVPGVKLGQFLPASAGDANAQSGFVASLPGNPWDFVLMIEGTLCFSGALSRRLGSRNPGLAVPFTVMPSTSSFGSGTAADETRDRAEMWLPLWQRPASLVELRVLFAEGRARLAQRDATDSVEFARAVATLGVDRGLTGFERLGFQERNGRSHFATPLGRLAVGDKPGVRLLEAGGLDRWLSGLMWRAKKSQAPGSVARAARRLERAIVSLCERDDPTRVREVFLELGRTQRALATSLAWTRDKNINIAPVPLLPAEWLERSGFDLELRLAAALASLDRRESADGKIVPVASIRTNLEPITLQGRPSWREPDRDVVWQSNRDLVGNLNAVLLRRLQCESLPTVARFPARLDDIAELIEGRTDDRLLAELLASCALIDWRSAARVPWNAGRGAPPALYALLELCFASAVPGKARIARYAASGDSVRASKLACHRLRVSDPPLPPAVEVAYQRPATTARICAAALFPISTTARRQLEAMVVRQSEESTHQRRRNS